MSYGTKRVHGKGVGYIVCISGGGVGTVCHGRKKNEDVLLMGKPGTLFQSLRRAQRAVRQTVQAGVWKASELSVMRVAGVAE